MEGILVWRGGKALIGGCEGFLSAMAGGGASSQVQLSCIEALGHVFVQTIDAADLVQHESGGVIAIN